MARITVEDCLEQVENRFELVMLATKRARQLSLTNAEPLVPIDNDKYPVIALREIAEGLINEENLEAQVERRHDNTDHHAGNTESKQPGIPEQPIAQSPFIVPSVAQNISGRDGDKTGNISGPMHTSSILPSFGNQPMASPPDISPTLSGSSHAPASPPDILPSSAASNAPQKPPAIPSFADTPLIVKPAQPAPPRVQQGASQNPSTTDDEEKAKREAKGNIPPLFSPPEKDE